MENDRFLRSEIGGLVVFGFDVVRVLVEESSCFDLTRFGIDRRVIAVVGVVGVVGVAGVVDGRGVYDCSSCGCGVRSGVRIFDCWG